MLAVIANHIDKSLLPGGFLGVDIFFAISGYVITGSLLSRPREPFGPFILGFYERRVRRIVPALLFCVVLTFLAASLFIPPGSDLAASAWRTGAWALAGGSNIFLSISSSDYFSPSTALNPFTQTWSLGIEEQFYAIYPIIFYSFINASGYKHTFKRALPAVFIAILAVGTTLYFSSDSDRNWSYFFSPVRYLEIASGCVACYLRNHFLKLSNDTLSRVSFACLTTCLFSLLSLDQSKSYGAAVAALSTATLLASNRSNSVIYNFLGNRLLRPIGLCSYSLYLWHWSILTLGRLTIGISTATILPIALIVALMTYVSYKWIELPFRTKPTPGRKVSTVGIGLGCLLFAGSAIAGLQAHVISLIFLGKKCSPERYQTCVPVDSPHEPVTPYISTTSITKYRCQSLDMRSIEDRLKECSSIRNPLEPTLIVVGDSFSGALSPAIDILYQRSRFNLIYLSAGGCHLDIFKNHLSSAECLRLNRWRFGFLARRLKPGDVVLVAASGRRSSLDSNIKTLAILKNALRDDKVQMVVQSALPSFKAKIPDICYFPRQVYSQWNNELSTCSRASQQSLAGHLRKTAKFRHNLSLLDDGKWLVTWDPTNQLCSDEICSTHSHGFRLYRDNGHLSVKGAQMLSSSLERLLLRTSLGQAMSPPKHVGTSGNSKASPKEVAG